jgi:hypothetical protein
MHVDIVENDWLAQAARLVCRLELNGRVEVTDCDDPAGWGLKLLVPATDSLGRTITADDDPKEYLSAIAERYRGGAYFFSVGPHDCDDCPIPPGATEVPMRDLAVE